jgi:DNA-binding MurR/RpiR family transcriptional regulator
MRQRAAGAATANATDKGDEPAARPSVHGRIRAAYGELPPAERRIADAVLNFPGDLAGYSATELAAIAEVSNTAVSRFVRRLGFANYEAMRRLARQEQEEGSPLYLIGRSGAGPAALLAERHVETVTANLRRTFSPAAAATLAGVAAAIAVAPQVWTAGFRHGRFFADYLRWSLMHARPRVRQLPGSGETLGESLVDVGSGDVLVVFAIRRRVATLRALVAAAADAGARILLVTDPGMIATERAEWVVRCETRTRGAVDDHTAAIAIAHILTEGALLELQETARQRLGEIDDLHDRLAELD